MIIEKPEEAITEKVGQITVPSRLGVKTTLGPITALLDRLGHPETAFPAVHIGGTSGKGSTSTFLANILTRSGYKTGLFTKPHLQSVRERFVIDQEPIPPETMLAIIDRMPTDMEFMPTWFELMTVVSFQYFADEQVDFGIIEVGLGGTFDATNVIQPLLSVLTNVGLDHTDVLGDTVEKIAEDKVGIIKPGKPVVSGVRQPNVIDIVKQRCVRSKSPLSLLGQDYFYSVVAQETGGSVFDFEMGGVSIRDLSLAMPGQHQVMNAAAAIAGAVELRRAGFIIPTTAIRDGLAQTRVPGRMEIVQDSPTLILDGAHSPPKMEALAGSLRTLFADKKRSIGVLAFSKGHDAQDSLVSLAPMLHAAVLTEFTAETDYGNKRAQPAAEVAEILLGRNPGLQIILEPDPIAAVQTAQQMACPDDLICVTGSIFLVGQVREFLTSLHGVTNVPNP